MLDAWVGMIRIEATAARGKGGSCVGRASCAAEAGERARERLSASVGAMMSPNFQSTPAFNGSYLGASGHALCPVWFLGTEVVGQQYYC